MVSIAFRPYESELKKSTGKTWPGACWFAPLLRMTITSVLIMVVIVLPFLLTTTQGCPLKRFLKILNPYLLSLAVGRIGPKSIGGRAITLHRFIRSGINFRRYESNWIRKDFF